MKIKVNAAQFYPRFKGDPQLVLEVDKSQAEAAQDWARRFQEGDVLLHRVRPKRSLDANSYLWVLCDKIAQKLGTTSEEVYRELILRVGVFEDVLVYDDALESFKRFWEGRGIGWICMDMPSRIIGASKVRAFCGSSSYDTKEMSRLIDEAVSECKWLGIETMTPDQLAELKSKWGDRN